MITLRVIKGVEPGRDYVFDSFPAVVGRDRASELVLIDHSVSRRHAVLTSDGTQVVLKDLDSSNGTFVNRERLDPDCVLRTGDRIKIGATVFEVESIQSGGTAHAPAPAVDLMDDGDPSSTTVFQGVAPIDRSRLRDVDVTRLGAAAIQKRLHTLSRVNEILGRGAAEVSEFLDQILEVLFDAVPIDRGAVLLRDPGGEALRAAASRTREGGSSAEVGISRTIVDHALAERSGILSADLSTDERFQTSQSTILRGMRSAICVPLVHDDEIHGILHVDSTGGSIPLDQADLEFVTGVANETATALSMHRARSEASSVDRTSTARQTMAELAHHVDRQVAELIASMPRIDVALNETDLPTLIPQWERLRHGLARLEASLRDIRTFAGDRDPEPTRVNLVQLVESVRRSIADRAQRAGIRLEVAIDARASQADLDAELLSRSILNLATNAVEAMEGTGGTLTIRVAPGPDGAVVASIEDTGPGLSAEARQRGFECFFSTKPRRGAGLGLPMARQFVEAQGGTLTFEDREGGGSRFTITLPQAESVNVMATMPPGVLRVEADDPESRTPARPSGTGGSSPFPAEEGSGPIFAGPEGSGPGS